MTTYEISRIVERVSEEDPNTMIDFAHQKVTEVSSESAVTAFLKPRAETAHQFAVFAIEYEADGITEADFARTNGATWLEEHEPEPSPAKPDAIAAREYAMETTPRDISNSEAEHLNELAHADIADLEFPYADTLESDIPLTEVLTVDAIEDYEAAQVAQARALIEERERVWGVDRKALRRVMQELYLIDGHYISLAEAQIKAARVTA